MNRELTAVDPHEKTAPRPYATAPKRLRGRNSVDPLDERLHVLRDALQAATEGDFSVRLPIDGAADGVMGEVALTFNALIAQNDALVNELRRMDRRVGRIEGKTAERASLTAGGSWAVAIDSINALVERMAWPVSEATSVLSLVANGDLSRDMSLSMNGKTLEGDFRELGTTVKTVVGRLRTVSSGVSRVVREMGTEGKLGGQASVEGLSGTWKDLVDDVNLLAGNITAQVRNIALITTAVANGDLSRKVIVEPKGEILELKNTINTMVEQLRGFASEVTRVAKEVGTEGKLGGQADVQGASGTWKDLTDNVNQMASNLTSQVRGIAKVVTAVADGDLSQKFVVGAKGRNRCAR